MQKYAIGIAAASLVFFASAATAAAASDYFLKIDGVEGESSEKGHEKQIEVMSWSWGMSNSGSMQSGGGGGAGKASAQSLSIVKGVDKASPKLFESCARGKHFDKVELSVRNDAGQDYLHYEFSDVLCESWTNGGSGDTAPSESLSLNYAKVEMAYQPASKKGTLGDVIRAGWDFIENVLF